MRTIKSVRFLAIAGAFSFASIALCQRVGDLVVTPTRISIDDATRSGSITVVNRGSRTVRYRLNLVDMEMSDDGILRRTNSTPPNSAASILRLSPREIVLEPGASQRIKILAIVPSDYPSGELRSHLSFEQIGKRDSASPKTPDEPGALKISIETRAVVTIPVIVNHGRTMATTSLSDAVVKKDANGWVAQFKLGRDGNRTVRGDVSVTFRPTGVGKPVVLGQILAMPVYFPNSHRNVRVPLALDVTTLGKGVIEIKFSEADRDRAANAVKVQIPAPG